MSGYTDATLQRDPYYSSNWLRAMFEPTDSLVRRLYTPRKAKMESCAAMQAILPLEGTGLRRRNLAITVAERAAYH